MTRTGIYFLSLGAVVAGAIALRLLSPGAAPVNLPPATQAIGDEPTDFVVHPWVAPGEETRGPRRIISLAPSITESICALGLRNRLVGRTQYCLYPPGLEKIADVGALTDTNFEKIKSLAPDVVFVTENSYAIIRTLNTIGVHVEPVPHETLEDVYTGIARLGDLCERPRTARALVGSLWTDVDRLTRYASARPHPDTKVLMALDVRVPPQTLIIAGPGTFLDKLLGLAGYVNAARDYAREKYPDLPLEALVKLNPAVILDFSATRTAAQESELYSSWGQVPGLQAIQRRRVIQIGGPQWLSAGPRIAIELHRFISGLESATRN